MRAYLRWTCVLALLSLPGAVRAQSDPGTFPLTPVCEAKADADGDCTADALDSELCVRGIVIAWKQFGNRGPGAIYDPESGCCLSIFDINNAPDIPIGARIEVCGWLGSFAGLAEIVDNPANSSEDPVVTVLDPGPHPAPCTPVSCADLADGSPVAERLESCLVQLCGRFQATGDFEGNTNYEFVDIHGDVCEVRIDRDTDIVGSPIPAGNVTIKGVLGQFDGFTGTCVGYQVLPRSLDDFSPPVCEVHLDVKPGSCPNPLNNRSAGVVPAAVLGTADFDVADVDPASLRLEGVAPVRWSHEDVAAPFDGALCGCTEAGPDGFIDLTLKFDTQALVAAIGSPHRGDRRILTLTGLLRDGTAFEGRDCIVGVGRAAPEPVAPALELVLRSRERTPTQRVEFTLPEAAAVTLEVFDAAGRSVKRLHGAWAAAGVHTIEWNVGGLPDGVYFYRLRAGAQQAARKFLILR